MEEGKWNKLLIEYDFFKSVFTKYVACLSISVLRGLRYEVMVRRG